MEKLTGLGRGRIWTVENKSETVDIKLAGRVARVLGVSLDWLVNGEGVKPTKQGVKQSVLRALQDSATGTDG